MPKLTHPEIDKRVREAMKPKTTQTTPAGISRLLAIAKKRKQVKTEEI